MHIYNAIAELILSRPVGIPGGFVIFEADSENDFVQYALEEKGLSLYWPSSQVGIGTRISEVMTALSRLGFIRQESKSNQVNVAKEIKDLEPRTMFLADDGVYVQCGRDIQLLTDMTNLIFREAFDVKDTSKVAVTLELDG